MFYAVCKCLEDGNYFALTDAKLKIRKYTSYVRAKSAMEKYLKSNQITDTINWSVIEVYDTPPID